VNLTFWKKLSGDEAQVKLSKESIFWILNVFSAISLVTFWVNFFSQNAFALPEPSYLLIYVGLQVGYWYIKERAKKVGICEPRLGELWVPAWLVSIIAMVFIKAYARDDRLHIPVELMGVAAVSFASYIASLSAKLSKLQNGRKAAEYKDCP
jgi:hypothetical protein